MGDRRLSGSRDLRWLAARALIGLGNDGLIALLMAFRDNKHELWSHHAAHHVLYDLAKAGRGDEVDTLLAVIEGDAPEAHAPIMAEELLRQLRS